MDSASQIIQGLFIPTQLPLDPKSLSNSEEELKDLGVDNNLAYTYFEGLIVTCKQEKTQWMWRESLEGESGLLAVSFEYPVGIVVGETNYSGKKYNFFKISEKKKLGYIIPFGEFLIFKSSSSPENPEGLDIGDTVIGIVEGQFLNAGTYYGDDPNLLSSYIEPV